VNQALAGEALSVYGDGSQTRCFLHVADAVAAITALANSPQAVGEVFNVGSTHEISIMDLARKVMEQVDAYRAVGRGVDQARERIKLVPYEEAYEIGFEDMQRRVPDISKIRRTIGWAPTRSLEQTLEDVIQSMAAAG
jgi:UDP-glucose 4-epimerase